jgi:hypothetical protein
LSRDPQWLQRCFLPRTLFPGFQADEGNTGVLTLAAKAKAVNGKDGFNVGFLFVQVVVLNLVQNLLGTRLGCPPAAEPLS